MTPSETRSAPRLPKPKKMGLILAVSFVLGVAITVAEPDLQVLFGHRSSYRFAPASRRRRGCRILHVRLHVPHNHGSGAQMLLVGCYALICIRRVLRCWFSRRRIRFRRSYDRSDDRAVHPRNGCRCSNIRSDRRAEADSLDFVALCSVGPILRAPSRILQSGQRAASPISAAHRLRTARRSGAHSFRRSRNTWRRPRRRFCRS